ncbi:aldo/keto reductase [Pedobacter yulinensis]|uniref:Aldo/keto reductase n=1 Tax=Pedobacter yulinensis TaxID=2126353 RepID=A0A2T3HQW0_9SPHI|nr:aldo/keto reductase [Pedobacter yulinensis]PST84850.1 aldo/keto reductase [Pedobacter yulinensis]
MKYRKIGNTPLELSVITFGAWAAGGWMWGSTDRNEAVRAIQAGFEHGVTSIDTAPIYGQGTSEEIVGQAIKAMPRDQVQVVTKYGMRWDLNKGQFGFKSQDNSGKEIDIYKYAGKESIIYECEQSLKRLGTDYIDLYQIHWPDETTPIHETMEAVSSLIQAGKVRYAGVCNYSAAQVKEADEILHIASNQIPFSMVKRDAELETIPYCIKHGKSVLAYSPLERGLLTGKITENYRFAEGDHRATHRFFSPEWVRRTNTFLNRIKPLANDKNVTLSQLVLGWTIQHPGITIALAGARNADQSVSNALSASVFLTDEEVQLINSELEVLHGAR